MGKEIIIHTDYQLFKYLQTQLKLQKTRDLKWISFLQQFHLIIKYKKGNQNNIVNMLSRLQ